jgi:hypothetical protein
MEAAEVSALPEKEVLTDSAKWTALIGFEHYFG